MASRLYSTTRRLYGQVVRLRYQQKTELVVALLRAVVAAGCPAAYLVGDTADTGGRVRPSAERLGLA